jgi:hypothetical protein
MASGELRKLGAQALEVEARSPVQDPDGVPSAALQPVVEPDSLRALMEPTRARSGSFAGTVSGSREEAEQATQRTRNSRADARRSPPGH